jgi:hypothetical protein
MYLDGATFLWQSEETDICDVKNTGRLHGNIIKFLIRQLPGAYMHLGVCFLTEDMRTFWKSICKFFYDLPQTKPDPRCGYTDLGCPVIEISSI